MSRSGNRLETWLVLVVLAVGGVMAVGFGLHTYVTNTAIRLHPEPQNISSVAHADPAPRWTDAVRRGRQIMRAGLSDRNLPGLSVAVGIGGDVVWAEGFGWADLDEQTLVTPETRFRIGTASKVLSSAAVGLLLDEQRLNLDAGIRTYVPGFPDKEWPVTLRQLMAHVAGTRTDGGDEGPYGEHCERASDALRIFGHQPLLFEPGTRYRYSSYGWMLVSAAVEAVAAEPFMTFMRRRVFAPLGMRDTVADSISDPVPHLATPYFPRYAAEPRHGLHLTRPLDYSCYAGASAFVSTPSDLVRFAMGMARGALLQPATVSLLQAPQRLASGEETGYGLGWDLEAVLLAGRETRAVGHDGDALGGMVASLTTFPEHGLVVAVTSNISYADTASLAVEIAEAFITPER